jgi:hypothetical protein
VAQTALGRKSKIYLPPMLIEFTLIKKTPVKVMGKEREGFEYWS